MTNFSGLRGPFLLEKKRERKKRRKNLNFVFDFIMFLYNCYGSAIDASNLHDQYYKSISPIIVS